jgi:AbrB family looped-hinge helix DNA binding protein
MGLMTRGKEEPMAEMIETRLATDIVVGKRGTIVIPAEMRKTLGICEGQKLFAVVVDGDIVLRRVSHDPVERLREAFAGVFAGVDPVEYVRELRREWDE